MHALGHSSEYGVARDVVAFTVFRRAVWVQAVAVWEWCECDVELAPVGFSRRGTRVRHGDDTGGVVAEIGMELVFDCVSGAAVASACGVSGLDEFAFDNAMKGETIIEAVADQFNEVFDGVGRFIDEELDLDFGIRLFLQVDEGVEL